MVLLSPRPKQLLKQTVLEAYFELREAPQLEYKSSELCVWGNHSRHSGTSALARTDPKPPNMDSFFTKKMTLRMACEDKRLTNTAKPPAA